jgi:hypothetical protein
MSNDEKNIKTFISFLMDASDLNEKIKLEMRGIKASGRILSVPSATWR